MSPSERSRAALPANIRKTLEESNLPIEVATAIADLCEQRPEGGSTLPQTMPDVHATLLDAERYRWLRDVHPDDEAFRAIIEDTKAEDWDAAIDAARLDLPLPQRDEASK